MIGTESSGLLIKSGVGNIFQVPLICPDCFTSHTLRFNSKVEVECSNCHIIIE